MNIKMRLQAIARDNPVTFRGVLTLLFFTWGFVVVRLFFEPYTKSWSPLFLLTAATLVSILLGVLYGFLLLPKSAFVYYRVILPIVRYVKAHPRGVVAHLWTWFTSAPSRHWFELMLDSLEWNRERRLRREGIHNGELFLSVRTLPLVVRREHLEGRYWGRDKVFSIALLFNAIKLAQNGDKMVLSVDLRHQSCGIYNVRGKEYIRDRFLSENGIVERYREWSKKTHQFLLGDGEEATLSLNIAGLRWASGGFLPVARWRGRRWVCLFYRDIHPLGWNIANGASETKREYKVLNELIYRETIEELVVCGGRPARDAELDRRLLSPPIPLSDPQSGELVKLHDRLRLEHDRIKLRVELGLEIEALSTPQQVEVTYHEKWRALASRVTPNVLLAVNPLELGVEVVRVGEFDLGRDECLLDGEVFTSSKSEYLVRRPVLLLSVDFLRQVYEKNGGSLGNSLCAGADDQRCVGPVPSDEYHLFLEDIDLRKARLRDLRRKKKPTESESDEAKRAQRWLNKLAGDFQAAKEGELSGSLATLLPTTWKVIELALSYRVL